MTAELYDQERDDRLDFQPYDWEADEAERRFECRPDDIDESAGLRGAHRG